MSLFTESQTASIHSWIIENRESETIIEDMIAWVNENTKKKRSKSPKKELDPNRVKRPVPASWMYREENRASIIKDHFDGEAVKGSIVSKKAQELWNGLSDEERLPYEEKRKLLWAEYEKTKGTTPQVEKEPKEEFTFKVDEEVEVPEGWDGPYKGKYLHKYVTGLGKVVGVGLFPTLPEAIEAASKHDNCQGVTLCKFGYTLREGGTPKTNPKYEATSWVKSGSVPVKSSGKKSSGKKSSGKKSSGKKSSGKKSSGKKSSGKKSSGKKSSGNEDEDEDEDVDENRKFAENILESEDEDEEEDDDEENEDDEYDAEVVEWNYKGVDYLVDEDSDIVYSSESQQPIGKRAKTGGKWTLILD